MSDILLQLSAHPLDNIKGILLILVLVGIALKLAPKGVSVAGHDAGQPFLLAALPLFFMPGRFGHCHTRAAAWQASTGIGDFRELGVDGAGGEITTQAGEVQQIRPRSNGFDLRIVSGGGTVASSISYDPGWRIEIEGHPVPAVEVDSGFLGFETPPGAHSVRLDYRPTGWTWGLALCGRGLYFYDAIAPIVDADSIDWSRAFRASRWQEPGAAAPDGDYVNCPLDKAEYEAFVAEVRAELEPIILRSKLTVTLDLGDNLRPISSDRQKVKQILLNLLSNALKFTHHGSVTVSARRVAKDRVVTLSVADTGIGIAPIDQDKIFEDFRQLDNSPTRAYGGTGLGLSICRRLAQMLNGDITVQSELGRGSTFTLTLPTLGRK